MLLAFYLALLNNHSFIRRLIGSPQPNEKLVEMWDFLNAISITIVFSGLMLLPGVLDYFVYLVKLPAMSRALLFAAFGSEQFSHQLPEDGWALIRVLNPLLRLCLSVYLIIGAPAYVNWQVRKDFSKKQENDFYDVPVGEQK